MKYRNQTLYRTVATLTGDITIGLPVIQPLPDQTVNEGAGTVTFTITLSRPSEQTISGELSKSYQQIGSREFGVPLDLASHALQTFIRARSAYGGDAWSSQVVKLLEDATGTDLRAPGFPAEL